MLFVVSPLKIWPLPIVQRYVAPGPASGVMAVYGFQSQSGAGAERVMLAGGDGLIGMSWMPCFQHPAAVVMSTDSPTLGLLGLMMCGVKWMREVPAPLVISALPMCQS